MIYITGDTHNTDDKIDSLISYKKWFFGHWHSDWGYEHYKESKYIPLYHQGIVI